MRWRIVAVVSPIILVASASAQTDSRSIGRANRGRLVSPAEVVETEHLVLMSTGHQFGTEELVGLITRSAARLQEHTEGPRLLVGALSRPRGGRLPPHSSHQSGRDADLGLFVTDDDHAPTEPARFVQLDETSGCGSDRGQTYCLDAERTFRFLVALLEDEVEVQWVLLAADLRELVLAAGRRSGASDETLTDVATITELRGGSASHRSHLHVRIRCPEDDRPRCVD